MKKVTAEHYYNCQVDDVFRFFSSEQSVADKYEALGIRKFRLRDLSESGNTLNIDARREVPAGTEIPSALRKFTGEYNKVRQREAWTLRDDGSRHCKMRVDLDGLPVRVQGEMLISPTENGCVNYVTMEVSGTLPLVGNIAAEFVVMNIEQQMESEYQYITKTVQTPETA